jgi:hypothetical protein
VVADAPGCAGVVGHAARLLWEGRAAAVISGRYLRLGEIFVYENYGWEG